MESNTSPPERGVRDHAGAAPRRSRVEIEIVLLADRPDLLPVVAGWVHGEWGHQWPGSTPASVAADVADYCRHDALPLALVALHEGVCAGTASLRAHSAGFPEALTPWLVRVYVVPDRRGAGVGRALVRAAERVARSLDAETLYLCTPDRQSFYAELGWEPCGEGTYHGEAVTVMSRRLEGS